MKIPQKSDRILIFAPHPDDEILAAGGYIYSALMNGAKVQVVITTMGENFGYAVGRELRNFLPINKKAKEFGEDRQCEAIKLLVNLGLKRKDIIFLGFPDKGLKYLLKRNWSKDKPYQSPLFRITYSPFEKVYQKKATFAGEQLLDILENILVQFKPTIIIMPSRFDDHPDHKTLAKFVQEATLEQSKNLGQLNLYSFLIHKYRFMYPLPYGLHPDKSLNPPLNLRNKSILWQKFPLTNKAILAKEEAILSYKTQILALKRRLLSFLRQNELFEKIEF